MASCAICEVSDEARPQETVIGVDLGVNTLIAATDGHKVILISGRAAKATLQYRNKQLARIQQRQSAKERDRGATSACNGASTNCWIDPSGVSAICATRRRGRSLRHSLVPLLCGRAVQRRGPAAPAHASADHQSSCTRKIIQQLDYKTAGTIKLTKPTARRRVPYAGGGASTAGYTVVPIAGPLARAMRLAPSISWPLAFMVQCSPVVLSAGS